MPARKKISAAKRALQSKIILSAIIAAFLSNSCTREGNDGTGVTANAGSASRPADPASPPDVKAMSGDPAAGKDVYEKHCHYCHGMKGYGDGPVGLALTPHPVNFVDDAKRMSKSDAELFKSITEGVRKEIGGESMFMPRWKEILTEKERRDVLAYVRKLSEEGRKKSK